MDPYTLFIVKVVNFSFFHFFKIYFSFFENNYGVVYWCCLPLTATRREKEANFVQIHMFLMESWQNMCDSHMFCCYLPEVCNLSEMTSHPFSKLDKVKGVNTCLYSTHWIWISFFVFVFVFYSFFFFFFFLSPGQKEEHLSSLWFC